MIFKYRLYSFQWPSWSNTIKKTNFVTGSQLCDTYGFEHIELSSGYVGQAKRSKNIRRVAAPVWKTWNRFSVVATVTTSYYTLTKFSVSCSCVNVSEIVSSDVTISSVPRNLVSVYVHLNNISYKIRLVTIWIVCSFSCCGRLYEKVEVGYLTMWQ